MAAKLMNIAHPLTSLLAEIRGILEGLKFAPSLNCSHAQLESDYFMVIRLIRANIKYLGDEMNFLMEVKDLALFSKCKSIH